MQMAMLSLVCVVDLETYLRLRILILLFPIRVLINIL